MELAALYKGNEVLAAFAVDEQDEVAGPKCACRCVGIFGFVGHRV